MIAIIELPFSAHADNDSILTGDTKLACEAVLCLSSGNRPSECQESINRYFDITRKKWSDTKNARKDFLKLCPASSDTSQNMPVLVDNIVDGAGRCNADYLNKTLTKQVSKLVCPTGSHHGGSNGDSGCMQRWFTVIKDTKPSYCTAYSTNGFTYQVGTSYIGDPLEGGHWVDDFSG